MGEYVGTDAAQTLTFDFEPKVLTILSEVTGSGSAARQYRAKWSHGSNYAEQAYINVTDPAVDYTLVDLISVSDKTLTIKTGGGFTTASTRYYYVVIG